MNGSEFIVKTLEAHGVTHVFGIPGAKIDSMFVALADSSIELVLCRHEQNAAFMAQAIGRLTGTIGVCLGTSGPGTANFCTGLATATTEGDPVLAIGGEVPIDDRYKHSHQSLNAVDLMKPVTKFAASALSVHDLPEVLGNAIRTAEQGRRGACFLGLPKDVGLAECNDCSPPEAFGHPIQMGGASMNTIRTAMERINQLSRPMLLLGLQASEPSCSEALQRYVKHSGFPYCATFQGPGGWVAPEQFVGRVGLFRNHPADQLMAAADGIICIGFDAVEYDPLIWNSGNPRPLVHVDVQPSDQDQAYLPQFELIGDLGETLNLLTQIDPPNIDQNFTLLSEKKAKELETTMNEGATMNGTPIHPLRVLHELRQVITPQTTLALDMGSHSIWMCRYMPVEHARQILISNGQQTLGVAMPWAMATKIVRPDDPVIAISGDGGFLFSGVELETATRIGSRFVQLIWDSRSYDMVAFQEQAHYGRTAGVQLGAYDVVKFAEAFGCKGYSINKADELAQTLREALNQTVPALIHIPIDYSDNLELMQHVHQSFIH